MNKTEFKNYIAAYDFKTMFREELLWNKDNTKQTIVIENEPFTITGIAEKCGLKILALNTDAIPTADIRKKIDTQVRKLFFHYILIMHNADRQVWLVPIKKNDKRELVTVEFATNQDVEFLFQKITQLSYSLDDEGKLTIVDVSKKVNDIFTVNSEKITTEFYKQFSIQHKAFREFIEGIDQEINRDWYASLMLNRLMFCYFIQKKRFLDNNVNYLREKLNEIQAKNKGSKKGTEFYSFYRSFLLTLFHEGLGSPDNIKHKDLIGKIPYLNGGLFDTHELETTYKSKINISDKAFEKIFDFFDQYEWHLDTRITATGKDINPDVIGYIFEKYINDRAQMGAYYTKEDITEYISKNCILPFLFDETNRLLKTETIDISSLVQPTNDTFIYDAVKKGTQITLPKEIEKGIKKVADRTEWNKPAPTDFALPTEIWRETIDRRSRFNDVLHKIQKGEVNTINDFITYNLNITGFTHYFLETTTNPQHIQYFYKALNKVTIIDPTCGSGAFLFAAMNILEPLYEVCITRMETFVGEKKGKHKFFEETLAIVKSPQHPNLAYFIYKTIILRNLYGVDIMKEATEIAKLRLFLKLVATVDANFAKPNYGLEPLPDIDFNIRAGNTLVGFATKQELEKGLRYTLDGVAAAPIIDEQCDIVAKTYSHYKTIQLTYGDNYIEFKKAKEELNKRLKELNHQLNQLLYKQATAYKYDDWLASHQPFHWFAEFYEIINDNGGFDVVIGNPPYVEYSKVRDVYKLNDYETEKCNNLYGFVIERSNKIMNSKGLIGMIIPISAFSNASMESLQKYFKKFPLTYLSNFHQRPAALFEGVLQRLSIFISYKETKIKNTYSTSVFRWKTENRNILFNSIFYTKNKEIKQFNSLKLGVDIEVDIFAKMQTQTPISSLVSKSLVQNNSINYRTAGGGYWVTILNTPFDTKSLSNKSTSLHKNSNSKVISAVLNSNLFWWYYSINFDQFNFKDYMIFGFRFTYPTDKLVEKNLIKLSDTLENELLTNATTYTINSKTRGSNDTITYNKFYSKKTMDEIDKVLAQHYGFTDEELDFIINYDIKYRMGKELDNEE